MGGVPQGFPDYAKREDAPGASPSGAAGAFPLGYQDHGPGGVNYQSAPLGYTATPPGTSTGPGGPYPHHGGPPLYDGNRYDPMYYSGQQVSRFDGREVSDE